MVILDLDLMSCYTSILLGLFPDQLQALQVAVEGVGLWNYIKGEMERNGRGHIYNKPAVKRCTYSSFFLGGNNAMINSILEYYRVDAGLGQREFKDSDMYQECAKIAQEVTGEMQTSAVIVDMRSVAKLFLDLYNGENVVCPTGHRYPVDEHSLKTSYANYLISYEFALLAQATWEACTFFPSSEVLGHYHDGNVIAVRAEEKDKFMACLVHRVRDVGERLGLRYPQRIELKEMFRSSLPDPPVVSAGMFPDKEPVDEDMFPSSLPGNELVDEDMFPDRESEPDDAELR